MPNAFTADLTDKVAVVTGGGSGIGLAIGRRLAREAAQVVLLDVNAERLQAARVVLPNCHTICADVTDCGAVESAAESTASLYGGVDLLFANAGVTTRTVGRRLWEVSDRDWRWLFDVNVFGMVNTLRAFVPLMLERVGGHVVITGSMAGLLVGPHFTEYFASKHAVLSIAESLQLQFERLGLDLGVTIVLPGIVETNIREWRTEAVDLNEGVEGASDRPLDADTVADLVLDGIRTGATYVLTHPEMMSGFESRIARERQAFSGSERGGGAWSPTSS